MLSDFPGQFLGPVAEIIGGAAFIAMRSLASKIVSSSELGKINSLFGIVESIAPLIYSPVLAAVYSATLTKMPGAFFLGWWHYDHSRCNAIRVSVYNHHNLY